MINNARWLGRRLAIKNTKGIMPSWWIVLVSHFIFLFRPIIALVNKFDHGFSRIYFVEKEKLVKHNAMDWKVVKEKIKIWKMQWQTTR